MKKYLKIILWMILIVIVGLLIFEYKQNNLKSLNPPILKDLNNKYKSSITLTGTGYAKAKVLFYLDNKYIDDVLVDKDGSFKKEIFLPNDGKKTIKAKQVYKNIISNFGEEYPIIIDNTPPDISVFKLTKEISNTSKQKNINITGMGSPNDFVLINSTKYKINNDGTFNINYSLIEGENNLEFALMDDMENKTSIIDKKTITVDTIPPAISSFLDLSKSATEESVVIDIGKWEGYLDSITSVPITGYIKGNIKKITVDGKNINWDEDKKIYQRLDLFVYGGLNKYKVVAEDIAGNISTGYIETTSERTRKSLDLNLNNE